MISSDIDYDNEVEKQKAGLNDTITMNLSQREFIKGFLTFVHCTVHEVVIELPKFQLHYEHQSWLNRRFLIFRRGNDEGALYSVSEIGHNCLEEGKWDGKEVSQLVAALESQNGVSVTRLRDKEIPDFWIPRIAKVTNDRYKGWICEIIATGFKTGTCVSVPDP